MTMSAIHGRLHRGCFGTRKSKARDDPRRSGETRLGGEGLWRMFGLMKSFIAMTFVLDLERDDNQRAAWRKMIFNLRGVRICSNTPFKVSA